MRERLQSTEQQLSSLSTKTNSRKPSKWGVQEVADWATNAGFPELAQEFREHEVSGDVLLRHVTIKDLKDEFHLVKFGVRSKVMDAIAKLREDDRINGQCDIESFIIENDEYTPPLRSSRTPPPQRPTSIPPKHTSIQKCTKARPSSRKSKTTVTSADKLPQKTFQLAKFGRPLDEIFFGHIDEENSEGEEDFDDEEDEENDFYFFRDKRRAAPNLVVCKSDFFIDQKIDLNLANTVQRILRATFRRPPILPLSEGSEKYRAAFAPNLLTHKSFDDNARCLVVEAIDDDEVTVDFVPYSDLEQTIRGLPPTRSHSTTAQISPAPSITQNLSESHPISLNTSKFHANISKIDEQSETSNDRPQAPKVYGYGRGLGKGYLPGCDDEDEDAILPAYGDSGDDMDEQVEREIEKEKDELRRKEQEARRRKEQQEARRFAGEQLVDFLEKFIAEQINLWEKTSLLKLETKRYKIYRKICREGLTIESMNADIKHLEDRMSSLRRELQQDSYSSESEFQRCAGALTNTIYLREELKWKIDLMKGDKPQKPPKKKKSKKTGNPAPKENQKKTKDSNSPEESDDGMSQFIDDDAIEEDPVGASVYASDEVLNPTSHEVQSDGDELRMDLEGENDEDEEDEKYDAHRETEDMELDHQPTSEADAAVGDTAMFSSEVVVDAEPGEMEGEFVDAAVPDTPTAEAIVDDAGTENIDIETGREDECTTARKDSDDPLLAETISADDDMLASPQCLVIDDDSESRSKTPEIVEGLAEFPSVPADGCTPEEPIVTSKPIAKQRRGSDSLKSSLKKPQHLNHKPASGDRPHFVRTPKSKAETKIIVTPSVTRVNSNPSTPRWSVREKNPVVMICKRGANREEPITLESSDDERSNRTKATAETEPILVSSNANELSDTASTKGSAKDSHADTPNAQDGKSAGRLPHTDVETKNVAAKVAAEKKGLPAMETETDVSTVRERSRSPSKDDELTAKILDKAGQAASATISKVHENAQTAVRRLNMNNAQALFAAMKIATVALSLQEEAKRPETIDCYLAISGSCREFDCVVEVLHNDKSLAAEYSEEVDRVYAMPPDSMDRFVEWYRYCGDAHRAITCPLSRALQSFKSPVSAWNPVKKRRRRNRSPDATASEVETAKEDEDEEAEENNSGSDLPAKTKPRKNRQSKKSKLIHENVLKSRVLKKVQDQSQKLERAWRRRAESHKTAIRGKSSDMNPTADNHQESVIINIGHSSEEEDILVPFELSRSLKPHQIEGIQFMWKNIVAFGTNGAILAHAMGLGKTLQVITLVATLLKEIRLENTAIPEHLHRSHIMILCPATLIDNWIDEFEKWIPSDSELRRQIGRVTSISAKLNPDQKLHELRAWYRLRGILVTSYSTFRSLGQAALLNDTEGNNGYDGELRKYLMDPGPSLVIADEGHSIKNPKAAISTLIKQLKTPSRICLTGYPLQNNLEEYWCMVDWVYPRFLGDQNYFKHMYSKPIDGGLWPESSRTDRTLAKRKLHVLNKMIQHFVQRYDATVLRNSLPQKLEFVISCRLADLQTKLYNAFLDNSEENMLAENFLERGNILQLICNHPAVLMAKDDDERRSQHNSNKDHSLPYTPAKNDGGPMSATPVPDRIASADMGNENRPIVISEEDEDVIEEKETRMEKENTRSLLKSKERSLLEACPNPMSIEHSCKVAITLTILKACKENGEKVLLFSKSIPTLNFLEKTLHANGYPTFRLDGGTSIPTRQSLINNFNQNQSHQIFLISISTGGVGVNLVSANRVILFDIGWNPSNAEQAIARTFRFGQKRRVFVYRLQTFDTWEHQLFKANVHKVGLAMRVVDRTHVKRYFNKTEIKSYFKRPETNVVCQFSDDYETQDAVTNAVIAQHRPDLVSIIGHESFLSFVDEEFDAEDRKAVVELLEAEHERLTGKRRRPVATVVPVPQEVTVTEGT